MNFPGMFDQFHQHLSVLVHGKLLTALLATPLKSIMIAEFFWNVLQIHQRIQVPYYMVSC